MRQEGSGPSFWHRHGRTINKQQPVRAIKDRLDARRCHGQDSLRDRWTWCVDRQRGSRWDKVEYHGKIGWAYERTWILQHLIKCRAADQDH